MTREPDYAAIDELSTKLYRTIIDANIPATEAVFSAAVAFVCIMKSCKPAPGNTKEAHDHILYMLTEWLEWHSIGIMEISDTKH